MSKNTVIKEIKVLDHTFVLKFSNKVGVYMVLDGKTKFFPDNKKYWNTPEEIEAAKIHANAIIMNLYPDVAEFTKKHDQLASDWAESDSLQPDEFPEMVDSPYGSVTQEQYDVMVTGENPNNISVPGPINKQEEEEVSNNVINLEAWALETGARGLTEGEVQWVTPFIDFIKLCNHINRTHKTGFLARNCTINAAGEIHNKDTYMGVILHNGEFIFVDFDGNVNPMSAFRVAKKAAHLTIERKDGSKKVWVPNMTEAKKLATDTGGSIYPDAKKKGFWIYPPKNTNTNTEGEK